MQSIPIISQQTCGKCKFAQPLSVAAQPVAGTQREQLRTCFGIPPNAASIIVHTPEGPNKIGETYTRPVVGADDPGCHLYKPRLLD